MPKKLDCCPTECPKAGDVYVCSCGCGCTIEFVKDCCSDGGCTCCAFACCGQPMTCVNKAKA